MMSKDVLKIQVNKSQSSAWGGMVDVYWKKRFSRRQRYQRISFAIQDFNAIADQDWNMRHTDSVNRTTLYFRDATDAVTFSFYFS